MVPRKLDEGRRDHSLDGWRGLAIIGVLIDHYFSRAFVNLGRLGVEMFFVLSGLLMAEILFVKRTPLPLFFARRLARVYPGMLVFATLVALAALIVRELGIADRTNLDIPWQAYLSVLTFTANYVSVLWRRTYDYDHIWSLCVEFHAYACLALVALACRRTGWSPRPILVALALLAIVDGAIGTWVFDWKYNLVYWRSDVRAASILLGALAFLIAREADGAWSFLARSWACPVLAAASLLVNLDVVPDPIKYSLGTWCLALSVATLAHAPGWFRGPFQWPALTWVGVVSYSIYMWQEPFNEVDEPALRIKLLPLALIGGVTSFYLIEGPARRGINRMLAPRPDIVPQPAIAE